MKIIDKLNKNIEEGRTSFSFEYFPPKTIEGVTNLYERLQRMLLVEPLWVDVTWGAGGSTSELTLEICETSQNFCGLETMMHLTCTNMPREEIDRALKRAKASGIQNILALRGDPPRGEAWKKIEGGFANAVDLVKYIRKEYGDYFGIAVAGYPEMHSDATNMQDDLKFLKDKIDAGSDFIITQLFYDVDIFVKFVKDCRTIGITCPIIPGIMPIHTYGGFKRMTQLCKTHVPKYIEEAVEPVKDNDEEVKKVGVQVCIDMCRKLLDAGVVGLHFYTLNLEKSVVKTLKGLNLITKETLGRSLPWANGAGESRRKEAVRPIFWMNRPRSYVLRTGSWDEFPNGRWGDYRSPAFGELEDYHLYAGNSGPKQDTTNKLLEWWGRPTTVEDVNSVFERYCKGEIPELPWNESPLAVETGVIKDKLVQINKLGFLTINSQPAVNGVSSTDPVFGWGPRGGFVYQKAYIEFFASPENLKRILDVVRRQFPSLTFHAVNLQGDKSFTNTKGTNAVTWGVFPGKEIVQPTVVDAASFVVWKAEALAVWKSRWLALYEQGSQSRKLLENIINSYFIVNIVDNNYISGDIFEAFFQAAREPAPSLSSSCGFSI
jgi:methylenetetrahydrofolate reductase (NADPH)